MLSALLLLLLLPCSFVVYPPPPRSAGGTFHRRRHVILLLLLLFLSVIVPPHATQAFELSCAHARIPAPEDLDFCKGIVTWRAASVYKHINYTDFRAGAKFTDVDQDRIARRQYEDLVHIDSSGRGGSPPPPPPRQDSCHSGVQECAATPMPKQIDQVHQPACTRALQRFVCASVFPECPHEGFGVPFVPVCRNLCRTAEAECGLPLLACEFFQPQDCTAALEEGFFELKADQGPYEPLPYLYALLLVVWTGMSFVWLRHTFRRSNHHPHHRGRGTGRASAAASQLCRLLSCVPIAKLSMMLLSLAFWSTCVTWGYCSFWMGVSLINCQLMYETFSLVGFVLIAKGWCITRRDFHPHEWRTIVLLTGSFYLASSSLLLVRRLISSSVVFWTLTGLLYGSAYGYVIYNVYERLQLISDQIRRLGREALPQRRQRQELLMLKHWMYRTLAVLLTVFCVTELFFCMLPLVHQIDLDALPRPLQTFFDTVAELDSRLWLTLIIHEVVEIAILFMVGFLFRPRLLSTFFYIEEDQSERRGRLSLPPPMYLIPVPADIYDGKVLSSAVKVGEKEDVQVVKEEEEEVSESDEDASPSSPPLPIKYHPHLIPRAHLSTDDLQFTIATSTPRTIHNRRQQRRRRTSTATGAGQLVHEPVQIQEQEALFHDPAAEPVKAAMQYHASQFLVVCQPDQQMYVAVPEEDEEEEGEGGLTR